MPLSCVHRSVQCAEVSRNPQIVLVPLNDKCLGIPDLWRDGRRDVALQICNELTEVFPAGLPESTVNSIAGTLEHLMSFIDVTEAGVTSVTHRIDIKRTAQEPTSAQA